MEATSANLPEPVQSALSTVGPPIGQALSQVRAGLSLLCWREASSSLALCLMLVTGRACCRGSVGAAEVPSHYALCGLESYTSHETASV